MIFLNLKGFNKLFISSKIWQWLRIEQLIDILLLQVIRSTPLFDLGSLFHHHYRNTIWVISVFKLLPLYFFFFLMQVLIIFLLNFGTCPFQVMECILEVFLRKNLILVFHESNQLGFSVIRKTRVVFLFDQANYLLPLKIREKKITMTNDTNNHIQRLFWIT